MSVIPFDRTEPDVCEGCLCAQECEGFPEDGTDQEKDAWLAACEQAAASRGGVRNCGGSE